MTFLLASQNERAIFLLEKLKRAVNASLQPGSGRFESVFKAIGFGGPIPDAARRQLLELSEVRHIVIHRNSKVDEKFIERCPWLGLKVGENFRLNHERYTNYYFAVFCYILELMRRCVAAGLTQVGAGLTQIESAEEIHELEELRDEFAAKLTENKETEKDENEQKQ